MHSLYSKLISNEKNFSKLRPAVKFSKIFKKIEKVKLGGDLRAFGGSVPFY